jgi:hypothetical protein
MTNIIPTETSTKRWSSKGKTEEQIRLHELEVIEKNKNNNGSKYLSLKTTKINDLINKYETMSQILQVCGFEPLNPVIPNNESINKLKVACFDRLMVSILSTRRII